MPIQIWTGDQRPQLMLEGGAALANGISGAGKSLADSLAAYMEQRKQENVRAKASETLFKETPELQKALNMDPETFKGLSAAEKNAMVQTGLGKLTLMQTLQQNAMQNEAQQMREVEFSKQRANEAGFNQAVAGMQKPDLMSVLGAAAKHGQLTNPNFDNLLKVIGSAQSQGPIALPPGFVPKNISVDQTGKATTSYGPEKDEKPVIGDYPWLYDDNLDQVIPKIRAIKDPVQRKLAIDERNNFEVMKGRPSLLEKLLTGDIGSAKAPAAGAPLALPKVKTELKKGQSYLTARGIAVWDGTKFIGK